MNKTIKQCLAVAAVCLFATPTAASAQENSPWQYGIRLGGHFGSMTFSDVDDNLYDSKKGLGSVVFGAWVQREFGDNRNFAVRPELAFTKRGGTLEGYKFNYSGYELPLDYKLKANYFDIRVSFIYNFLGKDAKFRPYVFVTPILGLATGGDITLAATGELAEMLEAIDEPTEDKIDLSDANIAKTYFAIAPGAGVKWQFKPFANMIGIWQLGLEASYQIGLTDTYGSKEKDGEAVDLAGRRAYELRGNRKFHAFEISATLGIPFNAFTKEKKAVVEVAPVVVERKVEEKPCYTLEEIMDLMAMGQDVKGKTICAIDAINFDTNKASIKAESYEYLNRLANTLIRTNAKIKVNGHTDNVGKDDYNMKLSKHRAESVVNYLEKKGVPSSRLSYAYYGATKPLASNDTDEGKTMNRRVEFEILK